MVKLPIVCAAVTTVAKLFPIVTPSSASINGRFCGSSWNDAISRCATSCPSGAPTDCMTGETCFDGTPCSELSQTPAPTSYFIAPSISPEFSSNINAENSTSVNSFNSGGTCGNGQRGNGVCSVSGECCSSYGFCGTTTDHCDLSASQSPLSTAPVNFSPSTGGPAPSIYGTCGGGEVGNGICSNNNECCSMYGFCGTSLQHCTNKVGSFGPNYPNNQLVNPSVSPLSPSLVPQVIYPTPQDGLLISAVPVESHLSSTGNGRPNGPTATTSSVDNAYDGSNPSPSSNQPIFPQNSGKRIIGYYAGWQWYDRDKLADPSNMDFKKVQRINYAFFQPDAKGHIYGTDRWADPQLLFGPYSDKISGGVQKCSYDGPNEVNCAYHKYNAGIINLAHAAGIEVYPSIGGWTLSDNFPALSADPNARDSFAKNCADVVQYYDFDGVDLDWEFPGFTDHSGTPADTVNFTLLLAAVRAALDILTQTTGKSYGLTAALPCSPDHIANIEVTNILNYLTEFNLMSYDFHGAWDNVTGVNAPLYPQGFGNDEFSIDRCVKKYVELGIDKKMINIGLPFYGRSFKDASKLNQPHGGNDIANWPEDDGTPQFFNIHKKLPNMIQMRDNKSKTQYAFISHELNPDVILPEGLVSFDDERAICDKVHYVQTESIGGFIVWELSGDLLDGLFTPLLDITNKKLNHPEFECCTLHSTEECEKEKAENSLAVSESESQTGFDQYRWVEKNMQSSAHLTYLSFFLYFLFFILSLQFIVYSELN